MRWCRRPPGVTAKQAIQSRANTANAYVKAESCVETLERKAAVLYMLQAALVRKDEEMDKELRSLRQQHEQLKHRFQAHKPLQ